MQYSFYSSLLFIISLVIYTLFFYSLFQKKNRLSTVFSLFCMVMATYTFFYSLELMSKSYNMITFFLKIEYFGVAFIPVLWFLLSYQFYTKKYLDLKMILLLLIVPLNTFTSAFTNDFLHLLYKKIQIINKNGLYVAELHTGPSYFIATIYSYLLLFIGQFFFFKAWKNSCGIRKKQSLLFLLISSIPLLISIIYLAKLTPGGVDPMPLAYSLVSLCYYVVVFKFGFLEMSEIIRENSFEQINEGIFVIDYKGRLIDFNTAAKNTFEFLNYNNLGSELGILSKDLASKEETTFELKEFNRYYEFKKTAIEEKGRISGTIYIFQDITEKKLMLDKLEFSAKYDYLTEVYNRHELFSLSKLEVNKTKRYKTPLTFLLFDIDWFKNINDKYGHLTGDLVIKIIASTCKKRLRQTDIIGRYGGEEFLILLPETSLENGKIIGESIRKLIEDLEIIYDDNKIKVTISMGITEADSILDLQDFINNADKALYKAKNSGRNRIEVF